MAKRPAPNTIGDLLYWSYANLAMAHKAVAEGATAYGRVHYMIRARLAAGLRMGKMDIGSVLDDERLKLVLPAHCAYCGTGDSLSIDHLIATATGGQDSGDNFVWACRSCNSAKGARDLLAWYATRVEPIPLLLIRRYLKQAITHARRHALLAVALDDAPEMPFRLDLVPTSFPDPAKQRLWVIDLP